MIGVRTVLQSSYWRETEAAAEAYRARRVQEIGADPRAIGALAGAPDGEVANAAGLLTRAECTGLKNICGATTHPAGRKP